MNDVSNIKNKAFSGIVWKFAERILAQSVSMVVAVILARILMPEDYSVVSIVTIFFTFCNIFIAGGFNTALIQKKETDDIDYSSVLTVSIIISLLLYIIMFFSAPFLAQIYKNQLLIPVIRVMSLTFFINALKGVICAKISKELDFKNFFIATLVGTVISAFVGIIMALKGFGPWALVAQQMTNSMIDTLALTLISGFKISFKFSLSRLKTLFSYGWKVFTSSLISVIYDEIRPLIIGIKFTPVDLAFYNKGKSFPSILNSSITSSISAVILPVVSKFQDNKKEVLNVTRRYIKVSSYLIFPLIIGFFAVADNFVLVVLTEKWMPCSIYIKIFCIDYLLNIVQMGNINAINAIGRSDIALKMDIIKKLCYFIIITLFIVLYDSPQIIAASAILCAVVATVINTYPNVRLIRYSYRYQILDLTPNMVISVLMGISVSCIGMLNILPVILLIIQIISGAVIYLGLSIITKNENYVYLVNYIKSLIRK